MARVNNLSNFLTDVASAIKTKKGSETAIPAANFDTEILALPSQGVYQTKVVTVTQNGQTVITPDTGYDAMDGVQVTTNVPEKQLQTKSYNFTTNQTIELSPDTGYDGFDGVVLTINVPVGEDLSAELTEQEEIIARLKTELENKAGHVARPNIFVQTTEPSKKDGIWLQTDKEVEHYVSDENVFVGGTWTPDINSITIPYKSAPQGAAVVENFIYVFPMYDSADLPYKINVATEEVTNLSAMPRTLNYGIAFAVGTDIYLFDNRGKSVDTPVLKYNTLTDTYSTVSASPQQFNNGNTRGVVKGTDIYLYGNSYDYKQMYKYDTLTDTYTYLSSGGNTYGAAHGALNLVGNQIYIFGVDSNSNSTAYKYDIDLNTFSAISTSPIKPSGLATITAGNQIYMFGGSTSPFKNVRVYNTTTDTYTNLANSTWPFRNNYAVKIEENVYFLGDNDSSKMRVYHLEDKSYDNNTVVLAQGKTYSVGYNTKLIDTSFESNYQPLYAFADAWFYTSENGLDNTIPTYYGDGTQWVKFKN